MRRLDLTGEKYGRLLIVDRALSEGKNIRWNCVCDCGKHRVVSTTHLRTGHTASCGCIRNETSKITALKNQKHGMWRSPEFGVWSKMLARCHNKNNKKYPIYGGRGIVVCDEWRKDFSAFFAHVGARPGNEYSLDRIDTNKGYEPGNVRWVTIGIQNNNKRTNVMVTIGGITKTVAQWSAATGIKDSALRYRLKAGWSAENLLRGATKHLGEVKAAEMMDAVLREFDK